MGYIGVDLDGTLANQGGFGENYEKTNRGQVWIGFPIPEMVNRVKKWLEEGKDVRIFTARVSPLNGEEWVAACRRAIEAWCLKYIGKVLPITCEKNYGLIEMWDDRAVGVICNSGLTVGVEKDKCMTLRDLKLLLTKIGSERDDYNVCLYNEDGEHINVKQIELEIYQGHGYVMIKEGKENFG